MFLGFLPCRHFFISMAALLFQHDFHLAMHLNKDILQNI